MPRKSKHSKKKTEKLKAKSKSSKIRKAKSSDKKKRKEDARKRSSVKKRLAKRLPLEEKPYEHSELESYDEKKKVISRILETYPDERLDLRFASPFELLVSAIFAAQARDEVVNSATEKLFQKYKNPEDFANLKPEDLKDYVSKINFWYKKAQTVINVSKEIIEKYQGKVPDSVDELVKIKGIGRKTANMVVLILLMNL
ncbi:Ultraviolet N-glycosylase/AP lyase [bacterium HR19]|nr:Ultraviolet N-glycosylase/AP lyase [bacterium HR19]